MYSLNNTDNNFSIFFQFKIVKQQKIMHVEEQLSNWAKEENNENNNVLETACPLLLYYMIIK